ncbi:MAG TPA: aldehyde dehydrogenase family protein, partial [Bacteroidota bacterium]|nr:aldehyde dehydrogenase family protein [Bacteroidota bacterium]
GATMVYGGGRKGAVLSPIILAGVPEDEPVMCNEVFAPVLVLQHYETEEEVIGEVNNSRFGLQAGLFTNDARFIFRAFRELEVGGLIINDVSSYRMDSMPYGGVKDSGFGREGVRYAMEEMTELKLMAVSW